MKPEYAALPDTTLEPIEILFWFNKNTDLRTLGPAECTDVDTWVVRNEDDEVVGLATSNSDGHVYRIGIKPDYRGKGLGRLLMDTLAKNYQGIEFECRASLDANDFYRHIGCKRKEVRWGSPEDLIVWRYYSSS